MQRLREAFRSGSGSVLLAKQDEGQSRGPRKRQEQRGKQRDGHRDGKRAKEASGDSGDSHQRQEDDHGRDGRPYERPCDLAKRLLHSDHARLAGIAMENDVFDDDDGVIDDQADGGSQSAEGHKVETFSDDPEKEHGDGDGYRNDQAGNERGTPVSQEQEQDDAGERESDQDSVANAAYAFAYQFGLIVVGLQANIFWQRGPELRDLGVHGVGDRNGVAAGLPGDVQQNSVLPICSHSGVHGHGRCFDRGNIPDAHGGARGCRLDGKLPQAFDVVRLSTDETEDELMVLFVEAWGIDDVGRLDGTGEIQDGDACGLKPPQVGNDMKLRHLTTLNGDTADTEDTIQRRLEIVGCELPQCRLRERGRGEAVAEDGKGREGEPRGGYLGS